MFNFLASRKALYRYAWRKVWSRYIAISPHREKWLMDKCHKKKTFAKTCYYDVVYCVLFCYKAPLKKFL